MKKILSSLYYLLFVFVASAQQNLYTAATIPPELLKNSNSIKRYSKEEFIITDPGRAIYKCKQIVTVLNARGENELKFGEFTDSFTKLDEVQIALYNKLGIPVKSYKKKDLSTQAAGQGLMDDIMYNYLSLSAPADEYPITVETSYTIKYNGLLSYPAFNINSPEQAVEQASFTVTTPKETGVRFKNQLTEIVPVITEQDNKITYTWEVKNVQVIPNEPGSGSWTKRFPKICLAPNKFRMDNYEGDMSSWNNFGKWFGLLTQKTNDLSQASKAKLNAMVAGAKDEKEKVKILYNNLQKNFRYVSIQLGIGGFKPFPASFTEQKKYGDCKGLSNYMNACLSAVGIKSYMALINAKYDQEPVDPSFPEDGFNHVILCVPMKTDTVWLECTSNYNEFGVLGSFTENRNALLITEDGGVLVKTPASNALQNKLNVVSNISVNENGSGSMHTEITSIGEARLRYIWQLQNASPDEQKSFLLAFFELSSPDKFGFTMPAEIKDTALTCTLDADFEKIAFKTGNKIFLNRQAQKFQLSSLSSPENRKQDYYFEYPYEKNYTTIYTLPQGYMVEHLPQSITLQCKYGKYSSTSTFDEGKNAIVSVAQIQLNQYKIPATDYKEVYDFQGKIVYDETQKIVIVKK